MELKDKLETASLLQKQKVKPSYNYTTLMIKNEVNEKLKVVHFTGVGRKINENYLL